MKKLLEVGVIVLFLGLAFAPSINADISKASVDSELVEITTEVCGINGGKHTVQLTKEEANEVEKLFYTIERRLNEVERREEAVEIFEEAVVELDKYGLLGGLNVKNAQRLVTGFYYTQNFQKKIIKPDKGELNSDEFHNSFCFVSGNNITCTRFTGAFLSKLSMFFASLIPDAPESLLDDFIFLFLIMFSSLYEQYKPIAISQKVGFGTKRMDDTGAFVYSPAEGNISTYGLEGTKSWAGPFYGSLGMGYWMVYDIYLGMRNFFGFKIGTHYFGFALKVGLQRERPKD